LSDSGNIIHKVHEKVRIFDRYPYAAHLYVTERCNLACQYCSEYDNTLPHPKTGDLKKWMKKIKELGVLRLGLQGGEPLLHPDIVELVRYSKNLGFHEVGMSSNGFPLNRKMIWELDSAGLDKLQISVDRMTPVKSTKKSLAKIMHKLAWFRDSDIRIHVSAVLLDDTVQETQQLIDTCLDLGIPVQSRVVHDDLINNRKLKSSESIEKMLQLIKYQERLKKRGEKIHSSWNIIDYQKNILLNKPVNWTCVAGYKYFFVSARGKFWPCSQFRSDMDIMKVTPPYLHTFNCKKPCQEGCGIYCIVGLSLVVSHPLVHLAKKTRRGMIKRIKGYHS